jgi:hypothetical protein
MDRIAEWPGYKWVSEGRGDSDASGGAGIRGAVRDARHQGCAPHFFHRN